MRRANSGRRMVASTQDRGLRFVAHNIKGVGYQRIDCIDCGAVAGSHCISRTGNPVPSGHVSRRRRAARLQWVDEDA